MCATTETRQTSANLPGTDRIGNVCVCVCVTSRHSTTIHINFDASGWCRRRTAFFVIILLCDGGGGVIAVIDAISLAAELRASDHRPEDTASEAATTRMLLFLGLSVMMSLCMVLWSVFESQLRRFACETAQRVRASITGAQLRATRISRSSHCHAPGFTDVRPATVFCCFKLACQRWGRCCSCDKFELELLPNLVSDAQQRLLCYVQTPLGSLTSGRRRQRVVRVRAPVYFMTSMQSLQDVDWEDGQDLDLESPRDGQEHLAL